MSALKHAMRYTSALLYLYRLPTYLRNSQTDHQATLFVLILHRIPYQHVVVGLMSNQLLIQCVCALLLRGTHNIVASEQGIITAMNGASHNDDDDDDDDGDANLLTAAEPLPGL